MAWPKEVPILTADDMFKKDNDGPGGRHCLVGWKYNTFKNFRERCTVHLKLIDEIKDITEFNDKKGRHLSTLARVWNRAMYALGYDVKKGDR